MWERDRNRERLATGTAVVMYVWGGKGEGVWGKEDFT